MSFKVLWEAYAKFDRSVPRSTFADHYWSANKLNFDETQMCQPHDGLLDGKVGILDFSEDAESSRFGKISDEWWLAGVMDAFHMGIIFPDIVRQHREVLAMGSIGPNNHAPECDRLRFCPSLFVFTDDKEASVSLGIERIKIGKNGLLIPAGTKVLASRNSGGKPYTEELKRSFQAHWDGMESPSSLQQSASEIFFHELAERIGKTWREVAEDLDLKAFR